MKKEIIAIIIFLVLMLMIYFIGRERFEQIENGTMIQVSEEFRD